MNQDLRNRGGSLAIVSVEEVVSSRLCHGCGACSYACNQNAIELKNFIDIGIRPVVDSDKCRNCGDCVSVCSGVDLTHDQATWPAEAIESLKAEWGPVLELWEGHATDEAIWFKGGSGGAATALAAFCLEQEGMHGALHVAMDPAQPHLNQTVMSHSREELTSRTGSRYAPAAVCAELGEIESAPSPCVLVAKPCDIAAARKAAEIRPDLKRNLGLTISIFCGGTPSTRGTLELLKELNVSPENVGDLRYRGHGWPGMTGVNLKTSNNGERVEMTYQRAWDTILTKHKPFRCHICPDGTGEFADIACGDPWYRPIEPGEKGETLIVVRTERGRELLRRAMAAGYIAAVPRSPEVLPKSQIGLMHRRRGVLPKIHALRLFLLPYPTFHGFSLWRSWRRLPLSRQFISYYRAIRHASSFFRRGVLKLTGVSTKITGSDGAECHIKKDTL
ncbi:MAG: Coenzyme F420 hydrogenase/dehydrogenase, beta subunit C-terminal domain [Planctomycetales bacterium]|nr:Coenzyme F420 hydrogenase/dehydrogenase, beta subunit C-terminal domain [Planctomycetales bacterium]